MNLSRLERLAQSAKELSEATSHKCIPIQADVRQKKQIQEAVATTMKEFGRIDFVICGKPYAVEPHLKD